MLLAAELYEPNTTLLTAAAVLLAAWYVGLAALVAIRWPRTPRPDPPTNELRNESPAVANLLTNGWRLTEDSLPATLLDLAARGYVSIDDRGDGQIVCRLTKRGRGEPGQRPYELQILDHLRRLAGTDGTVPAGALTTGPQDSSKDWWKKFRKSVGAEARNFGLASEFWPVRLTVILFVLGIPVFLLLQWALGFKDEDEIHMTTFALVVTYSMWSGIAPLALLSGSARMRDTEIGRIAAAHWLGVKKSLERVPTFPDLPPHAVGIWERHLAYGAALGVAGRAVKTLPLGAEHDKRAWTDYGDEWRQVRVRYPRFRPSWGRHPGIALLVGVLRTGIGILLLFLAGKLGVFDGSLFPSNGWWADWVSLAIALLVIGFAAWSLMGFVFGVMDLSGTSVVQGEVLRTRVKSGLTSSEDEPNNFFVAVYTGVGDEVAAWRVRPKIYGSFAQGQLVKVEVTRRLGYVTGRVG